MAVIDEFLEKEKRVEEARKKLKPYQETYADKHPWQAAALQLAQEGLQNAQNIGSQVVQKSAQIAKNTAADIGQGLQNTVSNIGATTMNMQPQYKPQTTFVEQAKPVVQKLPNPIYNAAKNTYNTVNNVTNKPINLMPSNLLSPITNRMQGIGKVLTDVYPYTKFVGGEEYGTIDNFKDFMDEAKIAYDLGVKNAIEERNAKDLNVTKLGDAALDLQILGRINPVAGSGIGANILNGATQFGTFGLLDSLKNKGISKDLPVDTLKDAALGAVLNPVISQSLKGLGLIGAKALERVNPQNYKRVLEGVKLPNNTYDVKSKLRFKPNENIPNKDANPYFKLGENNDLTDFTMGKSGPLRYGVQRPGNTVNNAVSNEIKSTITQNSPVALGIKEIAPNIAAKQEAQKQAVKENLTTENTVVESNTDTFKSYKDAFKALKEKGKGFTIVENPDKTYSVVEKGTEVTPKEEKDVTTAKLSDMLAPKKNKEQKPIKLNYVKQTREGYALYENPKTKTMYMGKDGHFYDMKYREVNKTFDVPEQVKNNDDEIENIAKQYAEMLEQNEVRDFHRGFAKALVNKDAETIKQLVAQGRGMNENSKKMFSKYTGIKLPSTIQGKKDIIDKWAKGEITAENQAEKTNSKLPTIKYKVKVDKNGVTADGVYVENDIYHTDGNAAYLKEFVNADTSKVERVTKFDEKMNNALTSYFESANNYTDKLEDLGKYYIIGKNTKTRVFKAGEYDNGEPRYVVLNEKYLIDKNNPELYYDTNNKYSAVSIRKDGKQIGIVMPIDARNLKSEEFIDVPKWKKVNPDIAKIAPKTVAKQQGKNLEIEDFENLNIQNATVKTKAGKEKVIEYVDEVPKGWVKNDGATTAPLGYKWYTNGKSLIKGERKNILVKEKAATEEVSEVQPKAEEKTAQVETKSDQVISKESTSKKVTENQEKVTEIKKKEPSKDSIQDSGEFLRGNRKTNENLTWEDLQEMNEVVRAKNLTKAKIYKKPTVEELEAKGLDRYQAALATYVYNHIAAKAPIKGLDDQKMYVDNISTIMDKVIETIKNNPDEFNFTFDKTSFYSGTNGWVAKSSNKLLDAIFPDKDNKVGRYDNIFRVYPEYNKLAGIMGGNRFIGALQIRRSNTKEIEKIWTSFNADKKETAKKEDWEKSFTILEPNRWKNKYQVALAGKKAKTSLGNIVSDDFDTREEAVAFAQKLYEMQVKAKAELKKANFERKYIERRNKDITSDELKDTFGFKGVNFGNYVNQKDRQQFLNYAYDSLYDLAELLNLPVKALSLNGKLGLAFGAQGHGGKAAGHYIPDYQEINMTRDSGAGTLAHEWWHAVDNYFGYTSEGKEYSLSYGTDIKEKGGLRQEIFDAFQNLMKNIKETPLTQEEIESRKNNIIARSERNIEYYANEVKNTFRNIEGVGEFVDNILKNKEKYMYLSPEEQHKVEWEDFGKLIPERRKTIQNMAKINWLLSEIERIGRAEELASRGTGKTEYYKSAEKLNEIGGMGNGYWTNPTELGARAFTTWLLDKMETKQIVNKFLARSQGGEVSFDFRELAKELKDGEERNFKVYWNPQNAEEKARIFKDFDNLFNTIKTRETEKGVELYDLDREIDLPGFLNNSKDYVPESLKNIYDFKQDNFDNVLEKTGLADLIDDIVISSKNYINDENLGNVDDIINKINSKLSKTLIERTKRFSAGEFDINNNKIEINENIDDISEFACVLSHEVWHTIQFALKEEIEKIPALQRTQEQNSFLKMFKDMQVVYSKLNDDLNKNPKLKDFYTELNKFKTIEEIEKYKKGVFAIDKNLEKEYNKFEKENKEAYKTLRLESEANKVKGFVKKQIGEGVLNGRQYNRQRHSIFRNDSQSIYSSSFQKQGDIKLFDLNTGGNNGKSGKGIRGEIRETSKTVKQANEKAKNYVREWYAGIEKDRYDVNRSLNSLINLTKQKAKDFSKSGLKISDKQIREIMPFLRERTEFPEKLDRPDLKKVWDNLSKSQKAELTKLADSVSEKFEKYYKNYQDSRGVVTENEIENHISHIWDLDKKKTSLLTNYFVTQSKFAKERTIDTLYKGIQGLDVGNGEIVHFTPKTLDYAEILKASSDNLIKATHDMQLANIVKKLKDGKTSLVQSMSKAPADWVEVNHPALNKAIYMGTVGEEETPMIMKTPVKVHPEIARTIQTVFETPATKNDFITGYDKLNSIFKQSQLGFSGFHMVALSESMLGNMGIKETVKILNPKRIWDEVVKGNWNIYKDDTIAKQAIDDGLQFGATLDLDRNGVEKIADDVSNWVEKRIPVIGKTLSFIPKTLSKAQKLNNSVLWDYLHNNYKFECYKILCQQAAKNGPISTKERQEIAQWVNDSFGGQVWENLGIKPSGRRTEQRFLLSPDWLRSTTRQFMGMFSNKGLAEKISKKAEESAFWKNAKELGERWGINSNTDDVTASNLRGKIARRFWVRSIIYSAILYNALNAVMRGYDREKHPELYPEKMTIKDYTLLGNSKGNKTYVFVGRNKDGSERYLRLGKQFREVPEMLEDPLKKLGGKASPNIQLISQITTGHTASGFQNRDMYVDKYPYNQMKEGKDRLKASGKVIAKSFMPYSLNTLFNPDADWTPLSLFAPVSKGMTKGKGRKAYEENIYNDKNAREITQAMIRNNIPKDEIDKAYKQARTNVRTAYKNMYIEAIETGNEQKVIEVTHKLKKKGLSNDEINYIYNKALEKIEE